MCYCMYILKMFIHRVHTTGCTRISIVGIRLEGLPSLLGPAKCQLEVGPGPVWMNNISGGGGGS